MVSIVKVLHHVEPGIDHYQVAVIEEDNLYYLASRLCYVYPNGPGPVEAIICDDDWNIIAGPFTNVSDAIKKYHELQR